MSLKNLLKMVCNISRKTITQDDYGNNVYSWSDLYTKVKCNIQNYTSTYGKFEIQDFGLKPGNLYVGSFLTTQDIKNGDRVECSIFDPSTLYVISVNPIVRATTGEVHHKKVLLNIEEV